MPQEVVARAYRDSGDYLSDVCPTCLAMGSEGISQRLRDRARYLKLMAWELERLADRPIDVPTIEQLNLANQIENALR
ncbi:hypothetical protein [Baaleninema sp.]|uniref:hypothetical protein n=1 Tax=Baaleninema sp. TaxID=3101197 RepID=UPI003D019B60